MDCKLIWPDDAISDLRRLVAVIARDNPSAARAFGQKLLAKIQPLARFPEMGRIYARLGREDVRELPVPPYRVIYRIHDVERTVTILVIWHGAMQGPPRPPA